MKTDDPRYEVKDLLRSGRITELLAKAAELHGHYCPGLALGVKAGYAAMKRLGFDNTGMEELLAFVECNNCFVDGVQFTTGCSFGNNAMIYKDVGKTAMTLASRKTRRAVRLFVKPRRWDGETASEREKEASELFRRVVKEREDDPVASERMRKLWQELSFATVERPEDDLFQISEADIAFPEFAPIVGSATCADCGEEFMETKAVRIKGDVYCRSCAKVDCPTVRGRGISIERTS
jgi:formylmethanofuran dehydrogenase subunit E